MMRMKKLLAILLVLTMSLCVMSCGASSKPKKVTPNTVVEFGDTYVEEYIREYIDKPNGAIKVGDLVMVREIYLKERIIGDYSFLQYCTGLKTLSIVRCDFEDDDIQYIADLTMLEELIVLECGISDTVPLYDLTELKTVNLSDNRISDIIGFTQLTKLTDLSLNNNQISSLEPLKELTSLQCLYMRNNQINDLTPLEKLVFLNTLYLSNNNISDISPLSRLSGLSFLELDDNQISDISALSGKRISFLNLENNPIYDWSPVVNCGVVSGPPQNWRR